MILPGIISSSIRPRRYSAGLGQDENPPAGSTSFDLLVNPNFNDSDRKLKDGTPFTSLMNRIYDGVLNYYRDGDFLTTSSESERAIEKLMQEGDSYQVGRHAFQQYQPMIMFFRLTGDVRLLDEITRLAKIAYTNGMRTDWLPDSGAWPSAGNSFSREPHGKRMFVSHLGSPSDYFYGTDDHLTDTSRALRPYAEVGWMLRQNENVTSPAGYNYKDEADNWEAVLDGYEKVWSDKDNGSFTAAMKVPENYNGRFKLDTLDGYERADANEWPVNIRTGTHTNHGSAMLHLYMGRLLGRSTLGDSALRFLMTRFLTNEVCYGTFAGREHAFWARDYDEWETKPMYSHPGVYVGYTVLDLLDLYLDGVMNDDTDIDFERLFSGAANSISYWMTVGTSSTDFIMKGDLQGKQDRNGTTITGVNKTIAGTEVDEFIDRDRQAASFWAVGAMIPWADDSGRIRDYFSQSMFDYRSGDGTWDTPEVLTVPLGVFMDEAGFGS